MRSEESRAVRELSLLTGVLVDLFLLLVNCVGIVGALTEILEIPWKEVLRGQAGDWTIKVGLDGILFWAGVVLFCAAVVLLRSIPNAEKAIRRTIICVVLYISVGIACKNVLSAGLSAVFQNAVQNLNEIYEFHIAWEAGGLDASSRWTSIVRSLVMTGAALYVLFPPVLLVGVLGLYDKGFCLILGNAVWFTAACTCDRFPGFFYLALCVLGAVATLVQKEFRDRPGKGAGVVAGAIALAGLCMAATFYFLLPRMDRLHEEMIGHRAEFYSLVNEEWIPRLKQLLPGEGVGSGVDVTGELGRNHIFAYTAEDAYRVTVDRKPQESIYLKGFVGGTYGEKEWLARSDRELEDYYKEKGMDLPDDYRNLVNISYEAARQLQHSADPAHIQIEELGGRGSYSIYPYGALLEEGYSVHGDGSVARKSSDYTFQYYTLSGPDKQDVLPVDLRKMERDYRRYVYDNYLEYPKEELPRLTACLETEEIRRDNVYVCVLDLMHFLESQASYNLDTANNPAGTDFVEYFLFDSHEGYCTHFASAAVLALRYFGIPARYVAGYTASPSDFVSDGSGNYRAVLTGRKAHAWTEIYLDAIGWVPMEMTPGAVAFPEDNRMEQLEALEKLSGQGLMLSENEEMWNPDEMNWQKENTEGMDSAVPGDSPEQSRESTEGEEGLFDMSMDEAEHRLTAEPNTVAEGETPESDAGMEEDSIQTAEEPEEPIPLTKRQGFRIFMKILIACLLLGALACLKKWDESRREAFRKADIRNRIFLLYRNFRKVFQTVGIRRDMDVDGEEFRALLQGDFQVSNQEYEGFCRILEKNSFAREAPSEEEFQEMLSLYDRLTKQVYLRAVFYKKLLIRRYLGCF